MISARRSCGSSSTASTQAHDAIPRLTTAVVPPSGVSSISSSPSIARTKPARDREAEPDAGAAPVAEPLERLEHLLARAGRDARAVVDDAQVDAIVHPARR